jgi:hypothetical protein
MIKTISKMFVMWSQIFGLLHYRNYNDSPQLKESNSSQFINFAKLQQIAFKRATDQEIKSIPPKAHRTTGFRRQMPPRKAALAIQT